MEALLQEIRSRNSQLQDFDGVPGLHLQLDVLADRGACPSLLAQWREGFKLGGDRVQARWSRNHPSAFEHQDWAEREWARLEKAGKVSFFPPGAGKPDNLNVNP